MSDSSTALLGYSLKTRVVEGEHEASGTKVLVIHQFPTFTSNVEAAQLGELVKRHHPMGVARVRHTNPWILERPSGSVRTETSFPLERAIHLTIQLLDRIARVHELGGVELQFSPESMWIGDGDAQTLTLAIPFTGSYHYFWQLESRAEPTNVARDLWAACAQMAEWLAPKPCPDNRTARRQLIEQVGSCKDERARDDLLAFVGDPNHSTRPRSARELARLLARVSSYPTWWAECVEAIPEVSHVRRVFDWDAVIAEGEQRLQCSYEMGPPTDDSSHPLAWWGRAQKEKNDEHRRKQVEFVLARAFQQRARRRFASADFAGAKDDIARAVQLDPYFHLYKQDREKMSRR